MDHAITLGNVLWAVGITAAVFGVIGGLFLLSALMNPFRSGH